MPRLVLDEPKPRLVLDEPRFPFRQKLMEPAKAFTRGIENLIGTTGSLVQWASEQSPLANTYRAFRAKKLLGTLRSEEVPIEEKQRLVKTFKEDAEWFTQKAVQWADYWQEQASKGWEAPSPEIMQAKWGQMPITKGISVIAEAAPNYIAAIAISVLTKSPQAGLLFISSISGASAYKRQREAGTDRAMAGAIAMLTASWEYVTEKIPFEQVLKPSKHLLKKMLKVGTLEAAQEFVQGIGENFLEYFGYNAKDLESVPLAIREGISHAMDGWVENIVAGAGLGVLGAGIVPRAGIAPEVAKPRLVLDEPRLVPDEVPIEAPPKVPVAPPVVKPPAEGIKVPAKPAEAVTEGKVEITEEEIE